MIIDERIIKDGITVEIIAKLIRKHEAEIPRFVKLYNYYLGRHDILNCEKDGGKQQSGMQSCKVRR